MRKLSIRRTASKHKRSQVNPKTALEAPSRCTVEHPLPGNVKAFRKPVIEPKSVIVNRDQGIVRITESDFDLIVNAAQYHLNEWRRYITDLNDNGRDVGQERAYQSQLSMALDCMKPVANFAE